MSRFVLLVRTPRAIEAAWVEDGPTVVAAAREALSAARPVGAAVPTAARRNLLTGGVTVRYAVEADQSAIVALVRSERLNPNDLDWRRFVVASDGLALVGAAQLRPNRDGSHELSSLVVRPHARARGVATRMIELLTHGRGERLYAVTRRANVTRFVRWGFVEIDACDAAREVRHRRVIGQMASILSLLRGRRPARLVVLERVPPTQPG